MDFVQTLDPSKLVLAGTVRIPSDLVHNWFMLSSCHQHTHYMNTLGAVISSFHRSRAPV
jgi:hypothetical protein